jgi:hypothetical protein
MMGAEQSLKNSLFAGGGEKTFIDKVLAKDDVNAIRELIKKKKLTREELLEILYLISGNESKLLNYGEWDRYVILKFFVWIREFIKVAELLFDYEDQLKTWEENKEAKLSKRTKKLLENNSLLIQHNAKFLIDLYLNIGRTSMSIGMSGFLEAIRNKYEVYYPNMPQAYQVENKSSGIKGLWGKR